MVARGAINRSRASAQQLSGCTLRLGKGNWLLLNKNTALTGILSGSDVAGKRMNIEGQKSVLLLFGTATAMKTF